jgi:hypothetical protein
MSKHNSAMWDFLPVNPPKSWPAVIVGAPHGITVQCAGACSFLVRPGGIGGWDMTELSEWLDKVARPLPLNYKELL